MVVMFFGAHKRIQIFMLLGFSHIFINEICVHFFEKVVNVISLLSASSCFTWFENNIIFHEVNLHNFIQQQWKKENYPRSVWGFAEKNKQQWKKTTKKSKRQPLFSLRYYVLPQLWSHLVYNIHFSTAPRVGAKGKICIKMFCWF